MKTRSHLSVLTTGLALLSSALVASANLVTYQVDMSVQETLGNFVSGVDRVLVAGDFTTPDWIDPLTTQLVLTNDPGNNPSIYTGTFNNDIPDGSPEFHKFIIDVGGTATTFNWESTPNRSFQATAGDQTLPVVLFSDATGPSTIITTQVVFSVNMGAQQALGTFDPNTDFVYVAGAAPLNNWVVGASTLTPTIGDTNIYEGTFDVTTTVGTPVAYKFIKNTFANGTVWEGNVGPDGPNGNRLFTFTNETTVLPTVYFNNIAPNNPVLTNPVTFQINMAVRAARVGFVPGTDTVWVAGDPLNSWSAAASELTNNPVGSNPYLYSGTFNVAAVSNYIVAYKFVINSGTWESTANRTFATSNAPITLPVVSFENINNLGALTISPVEAGQVTLGWTAGPSVQLQTNAALTGTWGNVPDTLGLDTATVPVGTSNTYFRLVGP